jgi:putative Ca2+/H+ antiporter (TMEM165/GDT1 family)
MLWKIFITAFCSVFVAEMADKTQLVGISLSAKSGKPIAVFFGSISAYIIVTAISVLVGAILGKHIKPEFLRIFGALMFIIIGVLMFFDKI